VTPDRLSSTIAAALDGLVDDEVLRRPPAVPVGAGLRRPRSSVHGDYSTNVALLVAEDAQCPPLELAGLLAERLRDTAGIRSVEVAPPGFVNVRLDVGWPVADRVLEAGTTYGATVGPARAGTQAVFGRRQEPTGHRDADPLYLVQRAHARARSLLRAGADLGLDGVASEHAPPPTPAEEALLRLLADYPEVVARAVRRSEWHLVGRTLVEVATGLLDLDVAVLPRGDEPPTDRHRARLLLVGAARVVLANGLALAGTTPAERW
jgi:arginyl-tRNA synthetase